MKKCISVICAFAIGISLAAVPANSKKADAAVKKIEKTMYAGTSLSVKADGSSYKSSNR